MDNLYRHCLQALDKRYPFVFIDIGAMGGIPKKWQGLRGAMKILAFEPDAREFGKLNSDDALTYLNYFVHQKEEDVAFYLSKEAGKSSAYQPNRPLLAQFPLVDRFDTVGRVVIQARGVRNLDRIVEEHRVAGCDFLKMDTEGTELAILQGGQKRVLPELFGLQVEVEFIEKGIGQPLFRDVDRFLDEHGFQIIDLRRQFWKRNDFCDFPGKGQLVFGDALYFKRIEVLDQQLKNNADKDYVSSKIYKAVLCCLVYRMFDYAYSVIKMGMEQNYLTKEGGSNVLSLIRRSARRGAIPHFLGRNKIYQLFHKVCEKIKPPSYLGFSESDTVIGNIKDR